MYIWYLIEFKRQTYLIDLEHDIALRIYLRKYLPKINIPPEIPSSSRDLILDSFKSGGNSNGKQESLEKEKLSSNNRGGGGVGTINLEASVSFDEIFIPVGKLSPLKRPLIWLFWRHTSIQRRRRPRPRTLLIIIHTLVPAYPGNSLAFLGCPPLAATVKNSSGAGAARNNTTPSRLDGANPPSPPRLGSLLSWLSPFLASWRVIDIAPSRSSLRFRIFEFPFLRFRCIFIERKVSFFRLIFSYIHTYMGNCDVKIIWKTYSKKKNATIATSRLYRTEYKRYKR